MVSTNLPLPASESDTPHPSLPYLSNTRANDAMASAMPHQTSPALEAAENPFADPLEETAHSSSNSASPTTTRPSIPRSPDAGNSLRANLPQDRMAIRDFQTMTMSDALNMGPKPSSSKSTMSTAPSSYGTGTTLISSTRGGATTTCNANPFADPSPHAHLQTGAGNGPSTPLPRSSPIYAQNHTYGLRSDNTTYLRPVPLPKSPIAPTPPPKSPQGALGSNRWTTISSVASHITANLPTALHASGQKSTPSLAHEALARESARRQDILLSAERAKHISSSSQPNLQEPHLRPSPSALRVAAELIRARDENASYGAQAVLTSSVFWIAMLCTQCGLVSASAAIAVIIEADQHGAKAYVGAGRVFWLVISIVVFVMAGGAAWGIWLTKGRGGEEQSVLRRLGCDEIGLLGRGSGRDVEMGRMHSDIDREGSTTSLGHSLRGRQPHRGVVQPSGSLTSVRTRDPEWQVLYATPEELRQMVSKEMLGDTPVRGGAHGLHSGSDRTRRYDEQRANPPRNLASNRAAGNLTRSDKSWPLRSSPNAQPFVNIHPEYPSPYQTPSPASEHALLQHHSSNTPLRNYPPSQNATNSSPLSIPDSPPRNTDSHHGYTYTQTEPRVEVLSPLSSLTASIQSVSQSSLPAHYRPQYIHGHRVASEERVRSLRESLESRSRGNSNTSNRDLSRVQSNTPSTASEMRIQEHVAEIEFVGREKEERVGRRRSRSVDVVLGGIGNGGGSAKKGGVSSGDNDGGLKEVGNLHHQKARDVLANVKGHFTSHGGGMHHPRGRSLGSVVREKMARLKEAGVEPDPEPAPPLPFPPAQPLQGGREIFIIGDDSPTKTPRKSPAKSTTLTTTPTKTPSKVPTTTRKSPMNSPGKGNFPSSPLSRKE